MTTIRQQITDYLGKHGRATATELTAYVGLHDEPATVANELNDMRTDLVIDADRIKGGGPALQYWLRDKPPTEARVAELEKALTELRAFSADVIAQRDSLDTRWRKRAEGLDAEIASLRASVKAADERWQAWCDAAAGHDCDTPDELAQYLSGVRYDHRSPSLAPSGYIVRATKQPIQFRAKFANAQKLAMSAARNGSGYAEVLSVVRVGVARKGAEWQAS